MPRETSQARHQRRRTGGRFAALAAPAAAIALTSAGTVAHPQAPAAPHAPAAAASDIATIAGGLGGPGKATTVALFPACHLAFRAGSLYVTDDAAVRTVNLGTDQLANLAGTGSVGPLGDGGPAARATVGACGVAFDHSGNLVIADAGQVGRVRVVAATTGTFYGQAMTKGAIYTVAGGGPSLGNGGPATQAMLFGPTDVAVDGAGNLIIDDRDHFMIRVVAARTGAFYGRAMTAGDIYTVAGRGSPSFSGDGGPAWHAGISFPDGMIVDRAGNLVIADTGNQRIRVDAGSTGTFYGQAMTKGDIYTIAGTGTQGFAGDGGPAAGAELNNPARPALDAAGNLVFADSTNQRIRVLAERTGTFYGQAMTAGDIYTIAGTGTEGFAGDGGPATSAEFQNPVGVTVDGAGNVVAGDANNNRVRVIAATTGSFYGQAMTKGDVYTIAGNGSLGFSGAGGPATSAELSSPAGMAVDGAGNRLIADSANERIRVVAASTATFYGRAMTKGDIYVVAGDGTQGFAGDAGPATGAELDDPLAVAVDATGNLVLSDAANFRIRVVAASTGTFYGIAMTKGDIYTVAGDGTRGFSGDGGPATSAELSPGWVTVDAAGNLVISDSGNGRIRVVAASTGTFYGTAMAKGHIYTVAGGGTGGLGDGGPATSARLHDPTAIAADAAGNLVIADRESDRIRVVAASTGTFYGIAMTKGDIYTVAGTGTSGFSGDGGPATHAELAAPDGVATDAAGNAVIADTENSRIRVVAGRTGTFYGQAMTKGDIYTIAGDGTEGFAGDGGAASKAELWWPEAVTAEPSGDLLIADTLNNRIRTAG